MSQLRLNIFDFPRNNSEIRQRKKSNWGRTTFNEGVNFLSTDRSHKVPLFIKVISMHRLAICNMWCPLVPGNQKYSTVIIDLNGLQRPTPTDTSPEAFSLPAIRGLSLFHPKTIAMEQTRRAASQGRLMDPSQW